MSAHFNKLTASEAEALALLAEECAEVIQVVGKILRHGYGSRHPADLDGPDNQELLNKELAHVHVAEDILVRSGRLKNSVLSGYYGAKERHLSLYLHHVAL